MKYPIKLETILTQAAHDLHVSLDIKDIDSVVNDLSIFQQHGYEVPEWIQAWIQLAKKNPVLTGQEHYKMRKPFIWPDPSEAEIQNHIKSEAYDKNETRKLNHAIHAANCFSPSAKEDCAYMIAARMLWNPAGSDAGGSLAPEWHFTSDSNTSLDDSYNFRLLVKILLRETNFWQDGLKPNAWKIPKLQSIPLCSD